MKKFIGVFVAVIMFATLCVVPCAMAADGSSAALDQVSELFNGADLSGLTDSDLSKILGDLDLQNIDIGALKDQIESLTGSDDSSTPTVLDVDALEEALDNVAADADEIDVESKVSDALSSALGGADMSWLPELIGDFDVQGTVDEALSGINSENSGDFVSTITDFFGGLGLDSIDLSSINVGDFDISSVLGDLDIGSIFGGSGGGSSSGGATDIMSGLADALVGGLKSLGLDTTAIEGILGSDLVNFFANMYIGFIGSVPEDETTTETTTLAPIETTPTSAPAETGDTGSAIVAIAALSVAAAAAFVCTKKKRA